ncbi:MAG: dethiobiotin synthase [Kiritimatiellae bacterium]|nr:dethiobiotin synthase [Kiritimatiellia bacterium]
MTKGIFITGTDTDIGKTVVTATVLMILREAGIDAVPMKPIQTGCEKNNGELTTPDLDFSLATSGLDITRAEKKLMCPCRFESACSPHLAARRADQAISLDDICHSFNQLTNQHESVIVEGAGGIMVPICSELTMLDLMAIMAIPVILVARPELGTINHTLLSLRELERAHLIVKGVIFNETSPTDWGYIEEDNRNTIEKLSGIPVIGRMSFIPGLDTEASTSKCLITKNALTEMPDAEYLAKP